MRKEFHVKEGQAQRLDDLLIRLGFVYAKLQDGRIRCRLGDFMRAIADAEVASTEDGNYAYLRIKLMPK